MIAKKCLRKIAVVVALGLIVFGISCMDTSAESGTDDNRADNTAVCVLAYGM